jgi:hypothetical protein
MATGEFKYLKLLYVLKGDIFEFTHASSVDNQNTALSSSRPRGSDQYGHPQLETVRPTRLTGRPETKQGLTEIRDETKERHYIHTSLLPTGALWVHH